jgi:hypothetical protein
MAGTWTATHRTVAPGVVDVTAVYTDVADPTISYSCNVTARATLAELNKFVALAKAGLTAYLAQHAAEATRNATIVAALNAP